MLQPQALSLASSGPLPSIPDLSLQQVVLPPAPLNLTFQMVPLSSQPWLLMPLSPGAVTLGPSVEGWIVGPGDTPYTQSEMQMQLGVQSRTFGEHASWSLRCRREVSSNCTWKQTAPASFGHRMLRRGTHPAPWMLGILSWGLRFIWRIPGKGTGWRMRTKGYYSDNCWGRAGLSEKVSKIEKEHLLPALAFKFLSKAHSRRKCNLASLPPSPGKIDYTS